MQQEGEELGRGVAPKPIDVSTNSFVPNQQRHIYVFASSKEKLISTTVMRVGYE